MRPWVKCHLIIESIPAAAKGRINGNKYETPGSRRRRKSRHRCHHSYQFDASEFDRVFNNIQTVVKEDQPVFVRVDCDCELRMLTTKGCKVKSGCHKPSDNGTI